MAAAPLLVFPAPLNAQAERKAVISGRCQYSDRVAQYPNETALILCDTVSIDRGSATATLNFSQRSWGSTAQFSGGMSGKRMTVSRVALRDDGAVAATGTCEIFYREEGHISAISCLAKAGSRSIAANFAPTLL